MANVFSKSYVCSPAVAYNCRREPKSRLFRNPSDNNKINVSIRERYYKPCEFFRVDKRTHEKIAYSKFIDFEKSLNLEGLHIDDLMFTFDKQDDRSCRKKLKM